MKTLAERGVFSVWEVLVTLFVFLFLPISGQSQIITTIAGGGSNIGEGVPATAANIITPWGATFDKSGNFYFAEAGRSRIRKVDVWGIIQTIAGTGVAGYNGDNIPATSAMLKSPGSVVVDDNGNVFIADESNHRVRRVDAISGIITTIAGTGVGGYNGDGIPATSAQLYSPTALCFDNFGNLFVSDNTNYRIRKISSGGLISTFAGDGISGDSGDGGPAANARFKLLGGIAFDSNGNLFIADWNAGKIRKVSSSGIVSTYCGTGAYSFNGDNIPATTANIAPVRLAVSQQNEVIFIDNPNDRVRIIKSDGRIYTIAGNGLCCATGDGANAHDARIGNPSGIAIDSCGNVFVCQVDSPRIRKVAVNPDCVPMAVDEPMQPAAQVLRMQPNPTTGLVTVTAGVPIQSVAIYNLLGQVVVQYAGSGKQQQQVDVSTLPPGMYIVRVNEVWTARLVKE